jgi:hypothetical protein
VGLENLKSVFSTIDKPSITKQSGRFTGELLQNFQPNDNSQLDFNSIPPSVDFFNSTTSLYGFDLGQESPILGFSKNIGPPGYSFGAGEIGNTFFKGINTHRDSETGILGSRINVTADDLIPTKLGFGDLTLQGTGAILNKASWIRTGISELHNIIRTPLARPPEEGGILGNSIFDKIEGTVDNVTNILAQFEVGYQIYNSFTNKTLGLDTINNLFGPVDFENGKVVMGGHPIRYHDPSKSGESQLYESFSNIVAPTDAATAEKYEGQYRGNAFQTLGFNETPREKTLGNTDPIARVVSHEGKFTDRRFLEPVTARRAGFTFDPSFISITGGSINFDEGKIEAYKHILDTTARNFVNNNLTPVKDATINFFKGMTIKDVPFPEFDLSGLRGMKLPFSENENIKAIAEGIGGVFKDIGGWGTPILSNVGNFFKVNVLRVPMGTGIGDRFGDRFSAIGSKLSEFGQNARDSKFGKALGKISINKIKGFAEDVKNTIQKFNPIQSIDLPILKISNPFANYYSDYGTPVNAQTMNLYDRYKEMDTSLLQFQEGFYQAQAGDRTNSVVNNLPAALVVYDVQANDGDGNSRLVEKFIQKMNVPFKTQNNVLMITKKQASANIKALTKAAETPQLPGVTGKLTNNLPKLASVSGFGPIGGGLKLPGVLGKVSDNKLELNATGPTHEEIGKETYGGGENKGVTQPSGFYPVKLQPSQETGQPSDPMTLAEIKGDLQSDHISQAGYDVYGDGTNEIENDKHGMPVYFRDDRDGKYLIFRGYINNLTEQYSPTWNPTNYIGRSEPVWVYERAERDMNFTLKMFAGSALELSAIYGKLRRLSSFTYPEYEADNFIDNKMRMKPPLLKFRIGELYGNDGENGFEQTCFMKNLGYTFDDNNVWEFRKGQRVPKSIIANISLQIIHRMPPNKDTKFYGYDGGGFEKGEFTL